MLDTSYILSWSEVEHDLYEENGKIFGVELDLSNNHKVYYCKTTKDGRELYQYLDYNIFKSVEMFNAML